MNIERILLIRHGQTDWNLTGRWQGFKPVPLNDAGVKQAKALADYLRDSPIRSIYSSDLSRAFQTAQVLGEAVGVTPKADARWRELNLGIFQGLTREEIGLRYPAEWEAFHADYMGYCVPKGENRLMMQTRAYEAWQSVIAEASGPEVAVVSHGGTIKMLLLKLFEAEKDRISQVNIPNTSITYVERRRRQWNLGEIAVVPHLLNIERTENESL